MRHIHPILKRHMQHDTINLAMAPDFVRWPQAADVSPAEPAPPAAAEAIADQAGPADEPLPLPYVVIADGRKAPLPGAESIFLRGGLLGMAAEGVRQHSSQACACCLAMQSRGALHARPQPTSNH